MELENALSPMIKNRSILADNFEPRDIDLIKKIKSLKMDVINNRIDPKKISLIRPEIVDSWIRSYNYGLNVFEYNFAPALENEALKQRLEERTLLLQSSNPFIHQLENMLADAECIILLGDELGAMLRVIEGNKKLEDQNRRFKLVEGSIWNEKTIGTCAHGISLIHGTPMQICGPEHYCEKYDNIFCSAAPIFDGNQNLAGTLSIVSPSFQHQSAHSLALVVSMAWAIQKEFQLSFNQELLTVALESTDEGVFTINKSGIITKANVFARSFFSSQFEHEIIGMHYEALLGRVSFIESVLSNSRPVFDTEINLERFSSRINIRSIQPLLDAAGQNLGCIFTFRKINNRRHGASQGNSRITKYAFENILGNSPDLMNSIELARKFSQLEANILLQGESGTGKEMFAQAIHRESRPDGPFVAVNCAAIPSSLIESELFGYEGGSFTGAEKQGRPGKIELANGGTLFLDEIGDMPLDLQPVLLRVLDEKKVMRIGARNYLPVDFRLITATNRNLAESVDSEKFRKDLFYRLQVLQINIPPLRERGQDIISLAKHFIRTVADQQQIPVPVLDDLTIFSLLNYDWPGNVRQLENSMLYAVNICSGNVIKPEHLPAEIKHSISQGKGNKSEKENLSIKEIEKIFIMEALQQSKDNISEAASLLKMSRSTLYRKIKEYDLKIK